MASPLNGNPSPIPYTDASTAPAHWRGGVPYEADGSLCLQSLAPIDRWSQGLPLSAEGRICFSLNGAAPNHFGAGAIPFNSPGFLMISEGVTTHFANGVGFDALGRIAMVNVGGAPGLNPLIHFDETGHTGDPVTQWANIGSGGAAYNLDTIAGIGAGLTIVQENSLNAVQADGTVNIRTAVAQSVVGNTVEFVVLRSVLGQSDQIFLDNHSGVEHSAGSTVAGDWFINQGVSLELSSIQDNSLHGVGIVSNQDVTTELRVRDAGLEIGDAGSNALNFGTLFANRLDANRYNGRICEYLLFDNTLTEDQIEQVRDYLEDKWLSDVGPPIDAVAHFDETGIIGSAPVTAWNNIGTGGSAFDLVTTSGTAANLTLTQVNGIDAVNSAGNVAIRPAVGQPFPGDTTEFVVINDVNFAGGVAVWVDNFSGSSHTIQNVGGSANWSVNHGSGINFNVPRVAGRFGMVSRSADVTGTQQTLMRVVGSAAPGAVFGNAGNTPLLFGTFFRTRTNAQPYVGTICEYLLYNRLLTDEEIDDTLESLEDKWGAFGPSGNLLPNSSWAGMSGSVGGADFIGPNLWSLGFWPPDDAIAEIDVSGNGDNGAHFTSVSTRGYFNITAETEGLIGKEINFSIFIDELNVSTSVYASISGGDVTVITPFPSPTVGFVGRIDAVYLITGPNVQARVGTGVTSNTTADFKTSRPQITLGPNLLEYKQT